MYLINVLVNDIHGSKILYFFNSGKGGTEVRDQGSEVRDQRAGIRAA
jgi:hypothetical protein